MPADPLYYEEVPGRSREAPLLVLLHGRGADESDLPPIVEYVARGWNAVSVRAPLEFQGGGYAWYHFLQGGGPEERSLAAGVAALKVTLDDIREVYPASPTVYLGFSQGALMALVMSTLRLPGLAGAAALSGYLPRDEVLPAPLSRVRGLPIFQSHAPNDFMLPYAWAESTRDRLVKAGADLTWVEHSSGHTIPLDSMERLSTWLARTGRA
jgi:phospholipase/carboxylesterase